MYLMKIAVATSTVSAQREPAERRIATGASTVADIAHLRRSMTQIVISILVARSMIALGRGLGLPFSAPQGWCGSSVKRANHSVNSQPLDATRDGHDPRGVGGHPAMDGLV